MNARQQDQLIRIDAKIPRLAWAKYDLDGALMSKGSGWNTTPSDADLVEWAAAVGQILTTWTRQELQDTRDIYIRFGSLPRSGKSRNHLTGRLERGVSVYSAQRNLLAGTYELTGSGLAGAAIMAAITGQAAYLVTGREIGAGSDGEPLIRDAEVICELRYDRDKAGFVRHEEDVE
jgi:hypothetical protein